jgi:4-amino-4-deoxy-L-arabinose transferase-like glycosyltransferase
MESRNSMEQNLNRAAWIILAMAVVFILLVRARYLELPLERDEGEFAYAGQLILQGIPPYELAYNMKLPGTNLAYAGLMAVFGQTTAGIHLGLLIVDLATAFFIFLMTRELFDRIAGAVAAACFGVLSTSISTLGSAAHATHFVALFGTAGVWVLWRAIQRDRILMFFVSGLLLGTAYIMKQQGVFLLCFGGAATLLCYVRRRPLPWLRILVACLAFSAGVILPVCAICLWLWRAGTFDRFWFWTIQYALEYVNQVAPKYALQIAWEYGTAAIGSNWPLWLLAIGGAITLAATDRTFRYRAFVLGFLLASFLCVCPGFHFRSHYFHVMFPALAIPAGFAVKSMLDAARRLSINRSSALQINRSKQKSGRQLKAAAGRKSTTVPACGLLLTAAVIIPIAAFAYPVWQYSGYYFSWSPETTSRRSYGLEPFVESPPIANYIRKNSTSEDRIAVLGSEPQLYFYSQRKSATGYIYMYPLMELHPFAHRMQQELIEEIEAAKPKFIVLATISNSWIRREKSDITIFNWATRYLATQYRPVGLVEIFPDKPTEYRWDDALAGARVRSRFYITVYRRVEAIPAQALNAGAVR